MAEREEQQPQEEKIITMPERVLRGYIQQMNEAARKKDEERDKEIAALRAEVEEGEKKRNSEVESIKKDLTNRPLKFYVGELESELGVTIQTKTTEAIRSDQTRRELAEQIPPHLKRELPQQLREILPQQIKDALPYQLEQILPGQIAKRHGEIEEIVKREATEHAGPIAERTVVELINTTRGKHYKTYSELLKKEEDEAIWKRRKKRFVQAAAGLAILGAVWWMINTGLKVSRTTAAGAQKTAMEAKKIATSYKTENDSWIIKHDKAEGEKDEARKAELSGLETKLTGEIAKKAESDKKYLDAQIADVIMKYTTLDATLNAELAKNKAREGAYTSYKELAEATKKSLDALALNAATRKYTDEEFGKLRKNLADADENIKKHEGLIAQLQGESAANSEEGTELRGLYDGLLKNYQTIADRMKKLEEKPKENTDYKPLERDR